MVSPLKKTFQLLGSTENTHALEPLMYALKSGEEEVQPLAISTILKRNDISIQVEIIRLFPSLVSESRAILEKQSDSLSQAFKRCLIHGDPELQDYAFQIILDFECYSQIPNLINILEKGDPNHHQKASEIIRELVNRLYEHCNYGSNSKVTERYLRNAKKVRQDVLVYFDTACSRFTNFDQPEVILEGILILSDRDHFAVSNLLSHSSPACKEMAGDILKTSKHPGVMQLIADFMTKNYPQEKAVDALRTREDPEFISHLLRWMPNRFGQIQQKNFSQIRSVVWLDPEFLELEVIPPALQTKVLELLNVIGIPQEQKLAIQEWLIRFGNPEARAAASNILAMLEDDAIEQIINDGLDSEDPSVQAWATGMLRAQGVPEALGMLIERLDSELTEVREAARAELQSFNIDLMMNLVEHLDPEVCLESGKLIKKIDPHCIDKLNEDISTPVRRKKMRAARAAQKMGLHVHVLPAIKEMLDDTDAMVRRTAVQILGTVPNADSVEALQKLLDDESPRVREAAEEALESIINQYPQQSELQADPKETS